jgi:hypothetical protein
MCHPKDKEMLRFVPWHTRVCVCVYNAHFRQECHNYNSVTTTTVSQLQECHNYNIVTTTTVSQLQHCHNYNSVTTQNL